ncbi:MAG: hypothetical protein P8M22_03545 [Phycisphaerales bacterium]|nr:hypothetical protein [Phycisphaerales bacterium]
MDTAGVEPGNEVTSAFTFAGGGNCGSSQPLEIVKANEMRRAGRQVRMVDDRLVMG